MSETVIDVRHVSKRYGELTAVDDLSFSVAGASCFGLLGPNGAGKTTMMKLLYGRGLRDDRPESTVSVFGYDPKETELAIKHLSGVVPQENNLDEDLNVFQNLLVFARFYAIPIRKAKQRIGELLSFLELSDKADSQIKSLSGGMKRRLVMARALLNNPRLLILDEPTTGLDPQVRHLIWDKLHELKKKGITILLTTHYMEEAFQLCDRIIIMDKGRNIMEGQPAALLAEHVERYVLELMADEATAGLPAELPEGVRVDRTAQRTLLYAEEMDSLTAVSHALDGGAFYLRQANLEDLFLRATGRNLHAGQ